MNPLLESYTSPFETVPFDRIQPEHFKPAFEQAFRQGREEIQQLTAATAPPTFDNTIAALDQSGQLLGELSAILFNLNHAETSDPIQELAREIAPLLSEFHSEITLNELLFARVNEVYQNGRQGLNREQLQLLDKTYKSFVRSGANLNDADKEKFRANSKLLSELSVRFSENVLAETNAYTLHLQDENDLKGLPRSAVDQAREEAEQSGKTGWLFTLQQPSFMPFLKYADNRELRRQMAVASGTRGLHGNENDNREIIRQTVSLRRQQAALLGFPNYASYVLDNRMAQNPEKVYKFLNNLKDAYWEAAQLEVAAVQEHANQCGADFKLHGWDWSYYAEKLKEARYQLNDESLRPYFELENCVTQVFQLAQTLYRITFAENHQIAKYHPDVRCYEVYDWDQSYLGILYMDFFPRKTKKPGAWMTEFRDQFIDQKMNHRPHISLVFNFPKATAEQPALLTYDDLRTLLHEFGHGLHGLFSNVTFKSLSGTSVYRDFVELPSQIMENWAEQKEWLYRIARHYQTGEAMPDAMIEKILEARNYNEAYFGMRQLGFGYLDMAWHTLDKDFTTDVTGFEKEVMQPLSLLPQNENTAISPSFSHIFSGGYATGYYGYKWAEVLDADAFSRFQEQGIFDTSTAQQFRDTILSKGGSEHPMKLYIDFLGREPRVDALLKRSGFLK